MSESKQKRQGGKPDYVHRYERGADGDDPWWQDGWQVEDMASVAAWYRSRLDDLLAALEGGEPTFADMCDRLSDEGFVVVHKEVWGSTLKLAGVSKDEMQDDTREAIRRQSPEHGTTTVESAFLLTCGGCDRLELWATHPDIDDRGDCPECGRLDFDWQRILIPQGPEHGTGRGTQEAYGIIGEALTLAYEAQKADGEARSGDCGQALEELSRLFRENPELVEALHRTDRQEDDGE